MIVDGPSDCSPNYYSARNATTGSTRAVRRAGKQAYGRPVPILDFTSPTSPALILPLTFTSDRKFVVSTVWPIRDLVCATSPAFTAPLPLVSPMSTPICTPTSPVVIPSLTPVNVTVIRWALVTPVKLTLTVVVP